MPWPHAHIPPGETLTPSTVWATVATVHRDGAALRRATCDRVARIFVFPHVPKSQNEAQLPHVSLSAAQLTLTPHRATVRFLYERAHHIYREHPNRIRKTHASCAPGCFGRSGSAVREQRAHQRKPGRCRHGHTARTQLTHLHLCTRRTAAAHPRACASQSPRRRRARREALSVQQWLAGPHPCATQTRCPAPAGSARWRAGAGGRRRVHG